jgi:hypothetical protein
VRYFGSDAWAEDFHAVKIRDSSAQKPLLWIFFIEELSSFYLIREQEVESFALC